MSNTKFGLIVFIDDREELDDAYKLLAKKGFSVEKGEMDEVEPKELYMPTGAEMKSALVELQELNGKDSLKSFLKSHGATSPKTLKKSEWPTAYVELNELNNVEEEMAEEPEPEDEFDMGDDDDADDDDADLFGEDDDADDDMANPPEAADVKLAVQKYAQKHGRDEATAILKKSGLNTVRGLANASDKALVAIMKAISK